MTVGIDRHRLRKPERQSVNNEAPLAPTTPGVRHGRYALISGLISCHFYSADEGF